MDHIPHRGQVYMVTIDDHRKPWLIVSNNARNTSGLGTALGVRITTTLNKPPLESIVPLEPNDGLGEPSRVLCDEIMVIWHDELEQLRGALSPIAMDRVDDGLRAALALH